MKTLVRVNLSLSRVRETALELASGIYARNIRRDVVLDIERFLGREVRLIGEPDEMLIAPNRLLEMIHEGRGFADCDDVAMLAAALLLSIGIPARFKAVCRDPQAGHFRHVFTEYKLSDLEPWRPLDPTVTGLKVYGSDFLVLEV